MIPIVATKLFIPTSRQQLVTRDKLLAKLDHGVHGKLKLISASAGFGKTVLTSEWARQLNGRNKAVTWLSLDEKDSDLSRFLAYLIAAFKKIDPIIGKTALGMLQAPQTPPTEVILTTIVNDITAVPNSFVLVLDDYHTIDNPQIDQAILFLLENMPPNMHLAITTREDPNLPLSRLRARGELTEIRAKDLRFTPTESAEFLNRVMNLALTAVEIESLETRTEGWVAGLQLAALSMQGQQNHEAFIESFTGSHRFILDYLLEEVLARQPDHIQQFLLKTSILDRLSPSLCESLVADSPYSGREMLAQLENGNLFIVPLDHERHWYRYHHLFGDLLRQQLQQKLAGDEYALKRLHQTASEWYEENGHEIDAFQHATAAQDLGRAKRLIEGNRMPLQFRGGALPILNWIKSLPTAVRDEHPLLWVTYGSCLLMIGQIIGVEEAAQAAESKLDPQATDDETRDLIGRIASMRATIAVTQHQPDLIVAQATKALAYLHPENNMVRSALTWMLGYVYQLSGDRTAAQDAYTEAVHACRRVGHKVIEMMATMGLAEIQWRNNQLKLATETYHTALAILEDPPPPASEAYLGLARIYYEWNELEKSKSYQEKAVALASLIENTDRAVAGQVLGAKIKFAEKAFSEAIQQLDTAEQIAQEQGYIAQLADINSLKIDIALQRNDIETAVSLEKPHSSPLSKSRILVAQERYGEALEILDEQYQHTTTQQWADQELEVCLHLALAYSSSGEPNSGKDWLTQAVKLAEPSQFIRQFLDKGGKMVALLRQVPSHHPQKPYINKILAAVTPLPKTDQAKQELIDPLTARELEILQLVAAGHSNQEICKQLFLALSTVKGHNRNIYGKLQVQRRTEAVARARELGLI